MESRKRRLSQSDEPTQRHNGTTHGDDDELSTEVKLAMLASLHPESRTEVLLEALLASDGSVESTIAALGSKSNPGPERSPPKKQAKTMGYQSSLAAFAGAKAPLIKGPSKITRKGQTLHLYSPQDIAAYTPCSIVHNFLEPDVADDLLQEMLEAASSFYRHKFSLFDNVVESPHTCCWYVDEVDTAERMNGGYVYNGANMIDVRSTLPQMRRVSKIVQQTVNEEIQNRIQSHYPDGKKLRFQSADEWIPNTSFANCYNGSKESVGWHADQLTYLGPRPVIGSISLGVAREFRVRRVVARDTKPEGHDEGGQKTNGDRADTEGQISIHLPHNSLLVMHAEMQEEWKHSIAPAQSIDPHPVAGNKRINITYRYFRPSHAPKYVPKCRCGVQATLRCVQRKEENRGKYMWMCHVGYVPGKKSCGFFEWAKFDDDGDPIGWKEGQQQLSSSTPAQPIDDKPG